MSGMMDQNLDLFEVMDLTQEERALIKGGNARRLLRL
jgi:predicted TIM-barrel fold metal-dependent hydrolase